jgi:hypothetical protein
LSIRRFEGTPDSHLATLFAGASLQPQSAWFRR